MPARSHRGCRRCLYLGCEERAGVQAFLEPEDQCRINTQFKGEISADGRRSQWNSIQSSHVIKCFGGCEGQSKPPGQRESFLLALPLQDSSNVRAATSNTTHVSQRKCLLCHGQHIKIKKFLKLSAPQRLCVSAFQILQPFEKLPHGPASLSDATAWSLRLDHSYGFSSKNKGRKGK